MSATRLDSGYLESLFQGSGFAIIACDAAGNVVAGNAAAIKLFGPRACAPGSPLAATFPESDQPRVGELLERCLEALEPVEFQFRLAGTESDPVEYAVWLAPVLEPDGALRGVSAWFRDITQRMRLERELDTRQKLASLGSLSGAVAHHYNNLLMCIATSVEYAINMNTTSAMRRALQRTAEAVNRAANMTRQLLSFAEGDRRNNDQADLTETVLYYFDENETRLARMRIHLDIDWQRIPVVAVPRDAMMLVLGNLVENAIEAMPNGGMLNVRLARRDEASVCLSITDTGAGINAADMEHLFEPFFTTKGELACGTTRKAGMGLAVSHGLIGDMGGMITAANVPGRGARFDIVLPTSRKRA